MNRCIICEKRITEQFWLCGECEASYCNEDGSWPDWLKALRNMSRSEKYRAKVRRAHELDSSDAYPSEVGIDAAFAFCAEMGIHDWSSYPWD